MWHFVMLSATRFIHLRGADDHNGIIEARRLAIDQSLGTGGFIATDHTDGMQFIHVLSHGHQDRHWAKWFAAEIGIEASYKDANAASGKFFGNLNDLWIEELRLIDPNDGCIRLDLLWNLGSLLHWYGVII